MMELAETIKIQAMQNASPLDWFAMPTWEIEEDGHEVRQYDRTIVDREFAFAAGLMG